MNEIIMENELCDTSYPTLILASKCNSDCTGDEYCKLTQIFEPNI